MAVSAPPTFESVRAAQCVASCSLVVLKVGVHGFYKHPGVSVLLRDTSTVKSSDSVLTVKVGQFVD